jgi:DnaJ-class molecular chaperone
MDKQTALNILNLDASVTVDEAQKAYRRLAKKYHPDVNAGNEKYDNQMKQINLAFNCLAPILPKTRKKKQSQSKPQRFQNRPESNRKRQIFSQMLALIKRRYKALKTAFEQGKQSEKKNQSRPDTSKNSQKRPSGQMRFQEIFEQARGHSFRQDKKREPSPSDDSEKPISSTVKPFQGYASYMAYKKKMAAGKRKKNRSSAISRVEKIQPIRPVDPIESNRR